MKNNKRFYDRRTIAENEDIIQEYNEILGEDLLTFGLFLRNEEYFRNWYNDAFEQGIIDTWQRDKLMDINEGLKPEYVRKNAQLKYERTITVND